MLASIPIDDAQALASFANDVNLLSQRAAESSLPDLSFPPIDTALQRLARPGSSLEREELLSLAHWSRSFESLLAYLAKADWAPAARAGKEKITARKRANMEAEPVLVPDSQDYDPLRLAETWAQYSAQNIMEQAPKIHDVYKIIFNVLDPNGELRDLPELRRLKEAIGRKNRELLRLASSYGREPELKAALQSEEPTQRDGRTVLAVRANFKGRIRGIVHEVSATGQTLFIEPEALVEKNNELVQLDARLKSEILRIFRETSDALRVHYREICRARNSLAYLDQILARALQSHREELHQSEFKDSGMTIWRARHPLLGSRAVPIDVDLPSQTRMLIITGPNTGGKTVTLKTIGLFALMRQFGLALPLAQGSFLPVFDSVLVDIGDEQSIDQSLSTFSGHMKVIAHIASNAGPRSLVLLDELGAGTDPEEGCALAMGLLDHFLDSGALTIVTTHHGILKNYGYTKSGCLNASMDFNSTKLAPTYRIVMGIPGESRALEIASQVGLPPSIVNSARGYLDEERSDIGELVKSLNEKHRALERMEREQERRIKSTAEDRRRLDLEALRLKQQELQLRHRGLADLTGLLKESRKTLENLVRELRESSGDQEKVKEAKNFLARLSEVAENQSAALEEEERLLEDMPDGEDEPIPESRDIEEGDEVLYGPKRRQAIALRKASSDRWLIELGSLKLTVSAGELSPSRKKNRASPSYAVELAPSEDGSSTRAKFELDLRGFRLLEALDAVQRQIDAASLQGLRLFSILHGTGEGVLGRGIHEFLNKQPAVEDYHFARPEEGGYGKTMVRLKD